MNKHKSNFIMGTKLKETDGSRERLVLQFELKSWESITKDSFYLSHVKLFRFSRSFATWKAEQDLGVSSRRTASSTIMINIIIMKYNINTYSIENSIFESFISGF
jgi:hypothetical protein